MRGLHCGNARRPLRIRNRCTLINGAIVNLGRLFVANVTFSGNSATGGGDGGSGAMPPYCDNAGAVGGAIFNNGLLCATGNNTFSGNTLPPGNTGAGNGGQAGSTAGPEVYDGPSGSQNCTAYTPIPTATNTPTPTNTPMATPSGIPLATAPPTPAPLYFLPAISH